MQIDLGDGCIVLAIFRLSINKMVNHDMHLNYRERTTWFPAILAQPIRLAKVANFQLQSFLFWHNTL